MNRSLLLAVVSVVSGCTGLKLSTARSTVSHQIQCPEGQLDVWEAGVGWYVEGCGRYGVCASHDGPCMPSRPPTCHELAQERYDLCLDVARQDGKTGPYWFRGRYGAAAVVANQLIASSQGERMMNECRHRYDSETAQCR